MRQKPYVSSLLACNQMQDHDAVPRHQAPMHPCKHASTLARYVFQSFGFNSPITVTEKLEQRAATRANIALVHSELVKLRFRHNHGTTGSSKISQRRNAGILRTKFKLALYFPVCDSPRIPQVV